MKQRQVKHCGQFTDINFAKHLNRAKHDYTVNVILYWAILLTYIIIHIVCSCDGFWQAVVEHRTNVDTAFTISHR